MNKHVRNGAVLAVFLVMIPFAAHAADANPIATLKPGEWYEVPKSHLDSVAPNVAQFPWLRGNVSGVTSCWAGGAFDTQRDRLMLGPGGGHAGYNGNEVYCFDLNDLKWHRITDPDPVIPGTEYTEAEKSPFAMHTYDGVEYLPPPVDRYVVIGGWGTERTYALDPDHPEHWEVYPFHGTGRTGDLCGYDPILNRLFLSTPSTAGKLSEWDPIEHRWTLRRSDSPQASYYETADVDWKHRLLVACGRGLVKTWSLTAKPAGIAFEILQTTGDTEILKRPSPGFCYVPAMNQFVAWGGGPDVYTFDIETKAWKKHPPAASNAVIPGKADQWGTFGRFRYSAAKNVFVLCNAVNQNVYLYRLTDERPNVITGVEAKATRAGIDTDLPTSAISVQAVYADGSRKDVTDAAWYFSRDPKRATTELQGKGVVTGIAAGEAAIRVVYSDPAFKRGFSADVTLQVRDIIGDATLDSLQISQPKLTIVAGDSFRLDAIGSFTRGGDHFTRQMSEQATWVSSDPAIATVASGKVQAVKKSGPVTISATLNGKTGASQITVVDAPVIHRIVFQVKAASPREGWLTDTGEPYAEARGYGWINAPGLATRDDRDRAKSLLLRRFVLGTEKPFKVKVPPGVYTVRVAMGDADYGAVPFEDWIAVDGEKLLYYEGHGNDIVTKTVTAGDDGLTFIVRGPINYLVIAPVGIDLEKCANDGGG